MKTKENFKHKKLYIILGLIIIFIIATIYAVLTKNNSFAINNEQAENSESVRDDIKISNAKIMNIYKIIEKNNNQAQNKEEIESKEEVLEFMTKYRTNTDLPQGTMQVIQEGREGVQKISVKKTYFEGELVSEEQIGATVIKASVDKIVEIGGANYSSKYEIKVGDNVYVTANRTQIMVEPNSESQKIATILKNTELKILEMNDDWYRIANSDVTGWVKKESTTIIKPDSTYAKTFGTDKSKEELMAKFSFNMDLTKPSELSLEQFKKVLTDPKDKNKIFENNAEYFYYVEKQYNINGLFIAAIGIHESAWGTSKIARDKNNLFGYGAYDSNPYNGAYTFTTFSESIDLMARVLIKYYLNPAGTKIFGGETAKGTYYNGPTFTGVNTRYATDKNWKNGVYNHMKYLYEKL